mmetsp:Transcript_22386/g.57424  ORF Transcript_22386/g.57424 Transcript_22386/m.57424 type:complete len:205 (-) Transcript_22386:2111-2725(-)
MCAVAQHCILSQTLPFVLAGVLVETGNAAARHKPPAFPRCRHDGCGAGGREAPARAGLGTVRGRASDPYHSLPDRGPHRPDLGPDGDGGQLGGGPPAHVRARAPPRQHGDRGDRGAGHRHVDGLDTIVHDRRAVQHEQPIRFRPLPRAASAVLPGRAERPRVASGLSHEVHHEGPARGHRIRAGRGGAEFGHLGAHSRAARGGR